MLSLSFHSGTLIVNGAEEHAELLSGLIKFDSRVGQYRAQAYHYAMIMRRVHGKIDYEDHSQAYAKLDELKWLTKFSPRIHQAEAFEAWKKVGKRGVAVLPTGSGKSFLAQMAINEVKRSTLVVVPTLDLVQQWATQLEEVFDQEIGILGGGSKEIRNITVSTYDSALLMMEFMGDKFGLLIFDECHHLPGERNRLSATMSIAPFRLGLTATPERNDDGENVLYQIVGPQCYRAHIDEMQGDVLSPYQTERIEVKMDEDEAIAYEQNRELYKQFLRDQNISFKNGNGWARFIIACAKIPGGREVFKAFREQKRIANSSRAKLRCVWDLLCQHRGERVIIFTNDNSTAYEIGKTFFFPVLTHHTKLAERKDFLQKFRDGTYPVLVTSKVLNEGVDVPEASVGIVVSGSGSTREHVQRLGRILRKSEGKQAILYELVSEGTAEYYVSERRREHRAYKK